MNEEQQKEILDWYIPTNRPIDIKKGNHDK